MSVTDGEYAMLSNAVYHDKNFIEPANYGFTRVMQKGDDETGFYGEAYRRGDDIVIVFRGSANALNYQHDAEWYARGTQPPEFNSALNFYDMVKKNPDYKDLSLSMTGHSLGGSAVQYVDAMLATQIGYQVPGVAFAPAGVAELFPGIAPNSITVRNYTRNSDKVPDKMNKQLGNEIVLLPFKNEAYEVHYINGIGEIVGTPGMGGDLRVQHSILGYWVDIGNLPTRTLDLKFKPGYYQSIYGSDDSNMQMDSLRVEKLSEALWSGVPGVLKGEGFKQNQSYYFQLPEQQLQDSKAMAYLERQSFNFDDGIECSDNIMLQIGNRSYKTESYPSNIA